LFGVTFQFRQGVLVQTDQTLLAQVHGSVSKTSTFIPYNEVGSPQLATRQGSMRHLHRQSLRQLGYGGGSVSQGDENAPLGSRAKIPR